MQISTIVNFQYKNTKLPKYCNGIKLRFCDTSMFIFYTGFRRSCYIVFIAAVNAFKIVGFIFNNNIMFLYSKYKNTN